MRLHSSTFSYLQPTAKQVEAMNLVRNMFAGLAQHIEPLIPDGPDKTVVMRKLREAGMWANVAITRHPDGAPREQETRSALEYPPDHPAPGDLGSVPL